MSVYAIADLHLSLGCNKPMDVFGGKWENYTEKLKENWQRVVKPNDYVILPGDISWATYLSEVYQDFSFINNLNGTKFILKGNHDYWWTTMNKMKKYVSENGFNTIRFVHNNYEMCEDIAVCGTRGWMLEGTGSTEEDLKIFSREKQRLILSLEAARCSGTKEIIVAMHYPPTDLKTGNRDFIEIMRQYGVKRCVYGHLHAAAHKCAYTGDCDGVELSLVSCDFVNFTPVRLSG